MRRLAAAILALGLLSLFAMAGSPLARAEPARDELLRATTSVDYAVRPDTGAVRVAWTVELDNNDPATAFRESGLIRFYTGYYVPVLRGASGLSATGPGGGALSVSLSDTESETAMDAFVSFDRNFHYGQQYTFTLSYELASARADSLFVTPSYVFLPAVTTGDSATVRVSTPDDPEWEVSLVAGECDETGDGEYECEAPELLVVAALVEVVRPDALQRRDVTVPGAREVSLTLRHFPGEEAWAGHVEEVARAALPLLERLFGFASENTFLEISQRGQQETFGYDGFADCFARICRIGVSPVSDDLVLVHELAHVWTPKFDNRWLGEGLAEFMSRRAAAELGALLSFDEPLPPERTVPLYLHDWSEPTNFLTADDDAQAREHTGYENAFRFFETLEQQYGMEAIQEANRSSGQTLGEVDSRDYFDELEEATGEHLDQLFLERVFGPSFKTVLQERRLARDQLAFLDGVAEDLGLRLPDAVRDDVDQWDFRNALRELGEAATAALAYSDARRTVEGTRSLWERLGLLYQDPDANLKLAASEFQAGDFDDSVERSERAVDPVERADERALYRVLVAVGMFAGVVLLALASFVIQRRGRSSTDGRTG